MAHKGKDKAPDTPSKNFVTKEEIGELLDDKIKAAISEAIKPLLSAASKDSASSSASTSSSKEGAQNPGELLDVAKSYKSINHYQFIVIS